MQYHQDDLSALLHELDVTGAEYRKAIEVLGHTIGSGQDIRASDPVFICANQAAREAQLRYRRALDAYKEHFRDAPAMRELALH